MYHSERVRECVYLEGCIGMVSCESVTIMHTFLVHEVSQWEMGIVWHVCIL